MSTKNHILVPIDYSEYSKQAAIYAIQLAGIFHADVKLFHSYYYPTFELAEITGANFTFSEIKDNVLQGLEETERTKIEIFENEINEEINKKQLNIKIEHIVMPGIPDDELAKITRQFKPLLIVMGIESNEQIHRPIFGTTAEAILRKCKVPVLILPANHLPDVEKPIPYVSYVTHFDESDFTSLTKLITIVNGLKSGIQCVHITSNPESELEKVRLEGLKVYLNSVYHFSNVKCHLLLNKDLQDKLTEEIIQGHIHILAFTLKKRNFLSKTLLKPTLARKIFYNLPVPLLVFHE